MKRYENATPAFYSFGKGFIIVGMEIESTTCGPSELAERFFRLVIPKFQRPFCWAPKKETKELISDLLGNVRLAPEGEYASTPYYIGQILVRVSIDGLRENLIVDGQQRLTVLWMVYKTLYDELQTLDSKDQKTQSMIEDIKKIIWADGRLRLQNQAFPTEFSQIFELGEGSFPGPREDSTNKVFLTTYEYLKKRLTARRIKLELKKRLGHSIKNAEALLAMAKQCQDVTFTLTTCSDSSGINQVFETLNYRGKPLDQYDLMMNSLYVKTDTTEAIRTSFIETWEKLNSFLGQPNFPSPDVFLRHYLEIYRGKVAQKKGLYLAYRSLTAEGGFSANGFSQDLRSFAEEYSRIINPSSIVLVKNHQYLISLISFLKSLELEMCRPVLAAALLFYKKHNDSFSALTGLLEFMCVFHLFFTGIDSKRSNSLASHYRKLGHSIYVSTGKGDVLSACKEFKASLKNFLEPAKKLRKKLDSLTYDASSSNDKNIKKQNACSKFVMNFIVKTKGKGKDFATDMSMEHVFGNNIEKRLPYIVPLEEHINNSIPSDCDISEKIKRYCSSRFAYTHDVAVKISKVPSFDESTVRKFLRKAFKDVKDRLLSALS